MTAKRALKRNRPATASGLSAHHLALVRRACAYIDAHDGQGITLARLAEAVELSPWHLQRLFKRAMGVSPRDYADARRSRRFRDELKDGESVAGATYGAGYGSSSRVYERAGIKLGMTPASYAKGGRGARISYAVVDSPLGRLLLAATEKGLCFLALGDDDRVLEQRLRAEFPALGQPRAQRAVGRACATNPVAIVVPCHRALRADGALGGYRWGLDRKEALLRREAEIVAE